MLLKLLEATVRFRIWPFVGNVFFVLLALIALSAWEVLHKIGVLDSRTARAHLIYQQATSSLGAIRASVYRSSSLLRGALPETPAAQLTQLRQRLLDIRTTSDAGMQRLLPLFKGEQRVNIDGLGRELADYWDSQGLIFDDLGQGGESAARLLADKSRQGDRVLEIAGQLDELNTANVAREEAETAQRAREFRTFLKQTSLLLLLLGAAIAGGTTFYLSRIEHEAEEQKRRAERAEFELRRLSNQLVHAQEDERRLISRELHDQVGQLLTGLRLELGAFPSNDKPRLDSVKKLAEEALRSVRDLAMLLRPSMLDDLGLPAALRWQAKEFSRRTGIDASVNVDGEFDNLPEAHRTCLYRVVQEATTNVARHSKAKSVLISLGQDRDLLTATVRDDGQGFEKNSFRTRGLGLLGMQERARELQGRVTIESEPAQGTIVKAELPWPEGAREKPE